MSHKPRRKYHIHAHAVSTRIDPSPPTSKLFQCKAREHSNCTQDTTHPPIQNQLFIYKFTADCIQRRDARAVVYVDTLALVPPKGKTYNRHHTQTQIRHIQARSRLPNRRYRSEPSNDEQEIAAPPGLQKTTEANGRATSPTFATLSTAQRVAGYFSVFVLGEDHDAGCSPNKTPLYTRCHGKRWGKGGRRPKMVQQYCNRFSKISKHRAQVVVLTYSPCLLLPPFLLRAHTPRTQGPPFAAHGETLTSNLRLQNGSYIPRGKPKHVQTQRVYSQGKSGFPPGL